MKLLRTAALVGLAVLIVLFVWVIWVLAVFFDSMLNWKKINRKNVDVLIDDDVQKTQSVGTSDT